MHGITIFYSHSIGVTIFGVKMDQDENENENENRNDNSIKTFFKKVPIIAIIFPPLGLLLLLKYAFKKLSERS